MHSNELTAYITTARAVAPRLQKHKVFTDFTESAITKGAAMAYMLLDTIIGAREKGAPPVSYDDAYELLETAGIIDDELDSAAQVFEIIVRALPVKEATVHVA